jgi:outer membrane protein assembly factor BamA
MARLRLGLSLLLSAFCFLPSAFAQDARFFIERIEVRNVHRVSPQLIIREALLREGSEYTEADLAAAAARLNRLPFVLSADFSLEKGSDRGRHVLVINVMETKPFFFLVNLSPTLWDDSRRTVDYDVDFGTESKDAALGFRWFVGGRGIVHVGVSSRRDRQTFTQDYTTAAIGYTQYDLFGTRAFATVNLRLPIDMGGKLSPELVVGMPVSANQTLTLDYEDTNARDKNVRAYDGNIFRKMDSQRLITLAWTYNTTNQPFVPTRGTIVRVAPLMSLSDRASYTFSGPFVNNTIPPSVGYAQHRKGYGVDLSASRYWELSDLHSVSAGVLAGWAHVEEHTSPAIDVFVPTVVEWRPAYEIVRAGYSRNLWKGDPKRGDSRIELDGRFVVSQRHVDRGDIVFGTTPDHEDTFQLAAGWIRRSSYGTLRLGLGYSWGHY